MEFSIITNNLALLLIIVLALLYFIGIRLGFRYGGWNRHLPYLFSLIVYAQYTLFAPVFFYFNDRKTVLQTDVSGYYGVGFFFNSLAIIFFIIGYWLRGTNQVVSNKVRQFRAVNHPVRLITIMFYLFYAVILANMVAGGINIANVYFGNEQVGLGARGATPFFQNFTDSLVALIVLAYLFNAPKKQIILWILLSFFLFSILGFRYRIILTLFGLGFIYLIKNKLKAKQIVIGIVGALFFFYLVLFSTINRRTLISRDYDELVFNPATFKYEDFFEQTRGELADMAVYKLFDNPNKEISYDYGMTMFGYVFVRMIPRSLYPDKDQFYPAPQIKTTIAAYDPWWAKFSGEATLSVAALYIGFGWLGIIFGHFIWGLLLRKLSMRTVLSNEIDVAVYVIVAMVSFQWITRGYFPQAIDHFTYMIIPVLVLKYFSKKQAIQRFENT